MTVTTTMPSKERRPGPWRLSAVAANAFASRPQFAGIRRGPLRLVMWVQLAVGDVRADRDGRAVCALSGASQRPRVLGSLAALASVVVMAGLWMTAAYTWPALIVVIAAALLYAPMARRSWAGRSARRALARSRPTGTCVEVHTVASAVPGAGASLLREVTAEADRRAWTLTLVAANPILAGYYRQFGFTATGPHVRLPCGQDATPMARHPLIRGGGGDG